jgi:Sec-independent protein secretion pathway component TatC|tara:strand:- start:253 stop:456 length:204 start_codon:yes stop_codon:yes gene_type:complete
VKRQPKPWIILSGLVFQIAAVMYLLIKLGAWADSYFKTQSNYFTLGLSITGIIIIIFLIVSQTKNLK